MKILLLGHRGMVGSAFDGYDLIRQDRQDFDISDYNILLEVIMGCSPDIVINCTGLTCIHECQKKPGLAYKVNVGGVINLAAICSCHNIKLVQFSTVFSGNSNVYTKTKKAMEGAVTGIFKNHLIVKLPWLFGDNDKKFQRTVLECLEKNKPVSIHSDEIGSPTYTKDVARFVMSNIKKLTGTIVVSNAGEATREQWASTIAMHLRRNIKGFKEIPRTLPMLSDSRVDKMDARKYILRHWRKALEECLGQDSLHHN